MSSILVDSSRWPLVRVRLPPSVTDDEVRQYLDELGELRARREPYGLIIIADESRGFTAKQRQMQADYIASGAEISRKYLKAFAFVAESAMQRGMLTAIFWLRAPEWPHRVFRTVEEASVWARTLVEEGRSSTDSR